MPIPGREEVDTPQDEVECYVRDSGVSFEEAHDEVHDQTRRGRSHRRGYLSPPPRTLPPPPPDSSYHQQTSASIPLDKAYAELLTGFRRQQEALTRLRSANEEHVQAEERLGADLLAMTHRYLQAQTAVDVLDRRCKEAEARAETLALKLEKIQVGREMMTGDFKRSSEGNRYTRERLREPPDEFDVNREDSVDRADTATVSASTVNSSEYDDLSFALNARTEMTPEEILKLVSSINIQALEVTRACIASTTFKAGVKMMQVDNQMVVDVTEGIGCVLVQILRSKDHSRNKTTVEVALRALLSYHISKLIEDWPFHAQSKRQSQKYHEDETLSPIDKEEFSEAVECALRDVATILSLCGSPGQHSSLVRSHRSRIGSTLEALFKSTEGLAIQIKGGSLDGPLPAEYSFLYARPGATFNKDLMQKHSAQQSMAIWKSAPKRSIQVLCTREIGIARLYRTSPLPSPLSRVSSQGSRGSQSSGSKELEVLSKAVIVFESDIDK